MRKKTICLNMIVKNESAVIRRSLSSIKKLIDYWVIVDTGSTDGTQDIIREFLSDIPGELHEFPWVDFSHNRNQALALSKGKGDYLVFIDADEELSFSESFVLPDLDKDYYFSMLTQKSIRCSRVFLINNQLSWYWDGVVHEQLCSSQAYSSEILDEIIHSADAEDGHRQQDPRKYHKDAALLEVALKKNSGNSRYTFFLAQSYLNSHEYTLSLKNYEKRIEMGGEPQEMFWSLYMIGFIQETLKMSSEKIIHSYCRAYQYRPSRAEPLFRLIHHLFQSKHHLIGYALARHALSIEFPKDIFFIEDWIYEYGLLLALANTAFGIGKYEEAYSIYQEVLSKPTLSPSSLKDVQHNLSVVQAALTQPVAHQ
jgi:glycosyltransferase involved in cell wall biosynthesis